MGQYGEIVRLVCAVALLGFEVVQLVGNDAGVIQ